MREIVIFASIASLAATIFLVALFELIFSVRRRKVMLAVELKVKEMKQSYTEQTNTLMQEQELKLQEAELKAETALQEAETVKSSSASELKERMSKLRATAAKEVDRAKEHAKAMEQEAERKADEYLESRKEEVEQELLSLVMSVTRKVIPTGISYDVHKELVMRALQDAKTETNESLK